MQRLDADKAAQTDAEKYEAAVERQQQKRQPLSPRREEIRRLLREKFDGKNAG